MSKRLMILGANDEQVPLIKAARARGVETVVVDANPTNPGVAFADIYVQHDLMDSAACIEYARQYNVDGVTTAVLSLGVRTVGAVAQALNLPGLRERSALYATDKIAMRQRLDEKGIPSIPYFIVHSLQEAVEAAQTLGLPVVVKPPDGSGSRGVRVVNKLDELAEALGEAGAALRVGDHEKKNILIEKFIEGDEYGVNGFFFGGKIHLVTVRAKQLSPLPYRQELVYVYPSNLTAEQAADLEAYLTRIATALELDHVAFHADMMLASTGEFRLIELGARLPGYALSYTFVPYATSVNTYDVVIDLALGDPVAPIEIKPQPVAMVFLEPRPGVVESIPDPASFLSDVVLVLQTHLKSGDTIVPVWDGTAAMRQGFVVAIGETAQQALYNAQAAAADFCSQFTYRN